MNGLPPGVQDKLVSVGLEVRLASAGAAGPWLLGGYTYHFKEAIRHVGGRWDAERRVWLLPGTEEVSALASMLVSRKPGPGLQEEAAPAAFGAARPSGSDGWGSKHYHGHRERLRQRFAKGAPEDLPDYELLELLLFHSVYRRDTKPIAKDLLARFGSLGGVLAAEPERLAEIPGLEPIAGGEAERAQQRSADLEFTGILLRAVRAVMLRVLAEEVRARPLLDSWDALIRYLQTGMGHDPTESFRILFLDRKNMLIREERQSRGTVDHTPLYPREVAKRALELSASAIIMVHNHPSGDPTPSRADVEMTRQVGQLLAAMGVKLHDHIIIGLDRHLSFRAEQLI